jgi:hypothetical protein
LTEHDHCILLLHIHHCLVDPCIVGNLAVRLGDCVLSLHLNLRSNLRPGLALRRIGVTLWHSQQLSAIRLSSSVRLSTAVRLSTTIWLGTPIRLAILRLTNLLLSNQERLHLRVNILRLTWLDTDLLRSDHLWISNRLSSNEL